MCKICGGKSELFDVATVLGRYTIKYFRCVECGMVETENPFWLDEAYSNPIVDSDIGLLGRNIELARQTQTILEVLFGNGSRFVDYGGGYGIFVRLMRDAGFNFFRYDRYCANLFAKGFDVDLGSESGFDLLTAFEVFEHLADPQAEVAAMLSFSRNILFTTSLLPRQHPPRPGEWWYYALHGGQHVALFTEEALLAVAERNRLFLNSHGNIHLLTEKPVPRWLFRSLLRPKLGRLVRSLRPARTSLRGKDYFKLTGQTIG